MGVEEQRAPGTKASSDQSAPVPPVGPAIPRPKHAAEPTSSSPDLSPFSALAVPAVNGSPCETQPNGPAQPQHQRPQAEISAAHEATPSAGRPCDSSDAGSLVGAVKKLGTAIGSTISFSLTGALNQAARGETADVSSYPNPFLYCVLRSTVASVVTYLKDRAAFEKSGLQRAFKEIGPQGRLMCGLMAANNALWIPAFMLTDLASALVIAGAQPFIHSIYESARERKLPSALKVAGLGFTAAALSTVAVNQSAASSQYPHASWGNLAAFAASLCFVAYMTINNRVVQFARAQAVSAEEVEAAKQLPSGVKRAERERELESIRGDAEKAAQERLRAVPFFSQVASAAAGLALFISQASAGVFSGGLGGDPLNTVIMGTLHGICTAGGLYLRTLATQTNKPSVVSLVAGAQIALTPTFGYLLFGSTVPQFAMVAGALALCSSLTSVAEVYYAEKQRQKSAAA